MGEPKFSVNREAMTRGMDGGTLTLHRVVYDSFASLNISLHDFKVDEECTFSCHYAYGWYKVDMDKKKQQEESTQLEAEKKRKKVLDEMSRVKKTQELNELSVQLITEDDKLASKCQHTGKVSYISKSNALHENGKSKSRAAEVIKIEDLETWLK